MLEYYLDDSGTHEGSPVVVWGGIVGDKFFLNQLDAAWRQRLLLPCDDKPPIKAFHSYDLEHSCGEFKGYNQGARDLTRRNFRQVIVESGVTVLAYGVSVKDWDQVVRKLARQPDFTAEQAVFGKAIFDAAKTAKLKNEALSLQFDQGRGSPDLRKIIQPTLETAEHDGRFVSYGFLPVASVPALQAADLVVHEAFRAFWAIKDNPQAKPRAHALRLFEDTFFGQANWMGRREIKRAAEKIEHKAKRAKAKARKL